MKFSKLQQQVRASARSRYGYELHAWRRRTRCVHWASSTPPTAREVNCSRLTAHRCIMYDYVGARVICDPSRTPPTRPELVRIDITLLLLVYNINCFVSIIPRGLMRSGLLELLKFEDCYNCRYVSLYDIT